MGRAATDRIETWSAIGAYIGRDARTAQRYERELGLPVRRLAAARGSAVYAHVTELDGWLRTRARGAEPDPEGPPSPLEPVAPPRTPAHTSTVRGRGGGRRMIAAGGVATVLAAVAGVSWLLRPAVRPDTPVVMAVLQNDTGEAVLDRLVPRLLQIELIQSPRLQVTGDARVAQTLALMERARDAVLTPALAREVCLRGNGGVVVTPGAARLGARYVLTAVASDCVSGRTLSDGREVVAAKDEIPQALDRLAAQIRRRLGESPASVSRFAVPVLPARTASFDALQAYSEAMWLAGRGQDVEAASLFHRALDLDAGFGLAWLGLAQTLYHARQWREDAEAMTRAYALRGSMSERDQLFTTYRYHSVVEKDSVAALGSLKALAQIYPRDPGILNSLSYLQFDLGEFEDAILTAEQAVRADPRSPVPRTRLMLALIRSGRPGRARAEGDHAVRLRVVDSRLNEMRIMATALDGDPAGARRLFDSTVGTPAERDALLMYASTVFGAGRAREFDAMVDRADALGRRQGLRMDWMAVGAALADMGAYDRARRRLALVEPDLRTARFHRAAALAGDPAQEEADLARDARDDKGWTDRDEARWPKDTLRNTEYGPEARAVLAMRRGDPAAAVRAVGAPDPYEFRTLELPYVRAQAWLAAGNGAAAATAFRAVLAHPGWSNWPQYPLSHLGLARALRLRHDVTGARREYDAFLAAWSRADQDLPQLHQARAERAALIAG